MKEYQNKVASELLEGRLAEHKGTDKRNCGLLDQL
jgi:hypothetical protein